MRLLPITNYQLPTRNKGFTLIEILVVCAIIAVLAAIVFISLNRSQANARDATRISDMDTIANAFYLYYQDKGTFFISGTGQLIPGTGHGWFHCKGVTYNTTSIAEGLANTGYVSNVISDPSGDTSCANTSHNYMFYYNDISKKASTYAWLENPTTAQTSTATTAIDQTVVQGSSTNIGGYKMNYAKTISN